MLLLTSTLTFALTCLSSTTTAFIFWRENARGGLMKRPPLPGRTEYSILDSPKTRYPRVVPGIRSLMAASVKPGRRVLLSPSEYEYDYTSDPESQGLDSTSARSSILSKQPLLLYLRPETDPTTVELLRELISEENEKEGQSDLELTEQNIQEALAERQKAILEKQALEQQAIYEDEAKAEIEAAKSKLRSRSRQLAHRKYKGLFRGMSFLGTRVIAHRKPKAATSQSGTLLRYG